MSSAVKSMSSLHSKARVSPSTTPPSVFVVASIATLLTLFAGRSEQCASSGVCGGGVVCPLPASPAAAQCTPSSCQPGYSCGHYGCARNRVRSSLTQKDGLIVPVDEFLLNATRAQHSHNSIVTPPKFQRLRRPFPSLSASSKKSGDGEKKAAAAHHATRNNIYGIVDDDEATAVGAHDADDADIAAREHGAQQALSSASAAPSNKNVNIARLTNPNFLFRQCCEDRHLPDECVKKCHFNTYTKGTLQEMFFKRDGCPIEAAADMQYCAAQGRDHTGCCIQNGIHTTLAGNKCLLFCDQRAGKITKLDYSFLPCYDRFEAIKRCFYDEIKVRMETSLAALMSRR